MFDHLSGAPSFSTRATYPLGKFFAHENIGEKALIPLPPAGFVSLFFAKQRDGANPSPAYGPSGVCGAFGRFID